MRIQPVTYKSPFRIGISPHQPAHGGTEVFFGSCGVEEGRHYLPCGNVEKANQRGGAMADILELYGGRFSRHHWLVRIFMFQRLYPSHLVNGDGMAPILPEFFRMVVGIADFICLLGKGFGAFRFFGGMQPVPDEMGADFRHILKNDLPTWPKWNPRYLPQLPPHRAG